MSGFDPITGSDFDLPERWSEDECGDLVRDDGLLRVIMTGPTGRYSAQELYGAHWVSVCKPGASSNSYFTKVENAIAHAEENGPPYGVPRQRRRQSVQERLKQGLKGFSEET